MIIVTLVLKDTPHALQMHFDAYADADKILTAYNNLRASVQPENTTFKIDDNYGSKCAVDLHSIRGMFITDLAQENKAREVIELESHRKDLRIRNKLTAEQTSSIVQPKQLFGNKQ